MTTWEQPTAKAGSPHIDSIRAAIESSPLRRHSRSQVGISSGRYWASARRHSSREGRAGGPSRVYQRRYAGQVASYSARQRGPGSASRYAWTVKVRLVVLTDSTTGARSTTEAQRSP